MKSKSKINPECGRRLKEVLKEKRVTQLALAEQCGYTQVYISNIVKGKRPMTYEASKHFAKALKVRQEYLLCKDDYKDEFSLKNHVNVICNHVFVGNAEDFSKFKAIVSVQKLSEFLECNGVVLNKSTHSFKFEGDDHEYPFDADNLKLLADTATEQIKILTKSLSNH